MELLGYITILLYYFGIIYYSKDVLKVVREQKLLFQFLFQFSLVLPGLILLYVLNDEKYIYYSDYSNYWIKSINYKSLIKEGDLELFKRLYRSVNYDQYNDLASVPISLVGNVLGSEFSYYVFSIYLIYGVPTALLFSNLILKMTKTKSLFILSAPILILTFLPFIFPVRFGFIGVAGLVIIGVALNIFFNSGFLKKQETKKFIFLGFLLLLLLLIRRWYTFWVASFFIINFIVIVLSTIKSRDLKKLKFGFINLFISGIVMLGLMFVFFYPFFKLTFLESYSDIYSAFRTRSLSGHFRSFLNFFGYSSVLLFLLGLILLFVRNQKYILIYTGLSLLFIVLLFINYNDFGPQHYYLVIPFFILIIPSIPLLVGQSRRLVILICLAILILGNFYISSFTEHNGLYPFFSKVRIKSLVRSDYDELLKIVKDIEMHYQQGYYTYCLSNNPLMNTSILQNIELPHKIVSSKGILHSEHVDKRDKFPNMLFKAQYLLCSVPFDLSAPQERQVMVYFYNQIMNGKYKNHYSIVKTYQLKDETKVLLLKKIEGFSKKEMEEMKSYFKNMYPNYPHMYTIEPLLIQSNHIKKGDDNGRVNIKNELIDIFPGSKRPSEVSFFLDSTKNYDVTFKTEFRNRDQFDVEKNKNYGEVNLNLYSDNELFSHTYVTYRKDSVFKIDLPKSSSQIKIEVDKGKNNSYCDYFQLVNFKIVEK